LQRFVRPTRPRRHNLVRARREWEGCGNLRQRAPHRLPRPCQRAYRHWAWKGASDLLEKLASGHNHRVLQAHSLRWRRRLTFIGGGLVVGLLAVGLAVGSDAMQAEFRQLIAHSRLIPLALTPVGFALAVYLAQRYFPNTQGSGIPQAIAVRALPDPAARAKLVGLRAAIGKVLLTLFGLLVGASTGREGPTVQVGASVMFLLGRLSPA